MSQSNTNVPSASLTDAGFQAPSLADILAGTISDLQAAFSGRLSFYDANGNLETSRPQSQLAISEAAILDDVNSAFLELMAGVDPKTSSGVMQDAIGRIYFMERRSGTPTVVTGLCRGAQGTVIPAGIIVQDTSGQTYTAMSSGTIGADGTVSIEFANTQNGPIPCPPGTLTQLYQIISGWDSVTNPVAGAVGQNVENRTDFEARRQASVAANSIGQNASLMGALLELPGVTDAYVTDNPTSQSITIGSATLEPHSLYCVVEGGSPEDIGQAILTHTSPGCSTVGSQSVTVQDSNAAYHGNGPSYTFHYDQTQTVPLGVSIVLSKTAGAPLDAVSQARQAIISALSSGSLRARMGGTIYAYRLASAVNALGDWAEVIGLTLSAGSQTGQQSVTLPINQVAVASADTISVEYG